MADEPIHLSNVDVQTALGSVFKALLNDIANNGKNNEAVTKFRGEASQVTRKLSEVFAESSDPAYIQDLLDQNLDRVADVVLGGCLGDTSEKKMLAGFFERLMRHRATRGTGGGVGLPFREALPVPLLFGGVLLLSLAAGLLGDGPARWWK